MLTCAPAAVLFERACRQPLLEPSERERGPLLDEAAVRRLLPHRRPFLFVDRVTRLDTAQRVIVGRYDIQQDATLLASHFPGRPIWPGVLQVEAVGQAGLCLARAMAPRAGPERQPGVHLTEILSARFAAPIEPGADLEIVACIEPDGLFTVIVGQCLQRNHVCSAVALRGLEGA
jgi:3-hydroxyacyl-[acyl-carrier-protein] dehydratase